MPDGLKGLMYNITRAGATITEGEYKLADEINEKFELLFRSLMNDEKA
jgi:hypothetical protein